MDNIQVEYDGRYPNACSGRLTIKKDGELIYQERHCCRSTGCVWFDDEWGEHVVSGELLWEDANQFDEEVQEAVRQRLSQVAVCCGGCI
jgi:Ribonuclease G/E